MTLPEIDMDRVVMAVITVGVMFASMRLLYGYWPWQLHPTLRRQRLWHIPMAAVLPLRPAARLFLRTAFGLQNLRSLQIWMTTSAERE